MPQVNWPHVRRHQPRKALNHAANLEADFEALDACVKLSTSKHHKLPSSLETDISEGILKAFSDHDYPYEISEADRDLIKGLTLKHITAEAAERARDRIPLRQYHGLRKSCLGLLAKFNREHSQSHPGTAVTRNECGTKNLMEPSPELEVSRGFRGSVDRISEGVRPATLSYGDDIHEGAGQADSFRGKRHGATEAADVLDRPRKKGRKRKNQDGLKGATEAADVVARPRKKGRKRKKRNGLKDATETADELDRPEKKGRKRKNLDGLNQTIGGDRVSATGDHDSTLKIMGNQHEAEEAHVHNGESYSGAEPDDRGTLKDLLRIFNNSEAQCEHLRLQLQGLENGQLEESTTWNAADELVDVEHILGEEEKADVEALEGDTLVDDPSDEVLRPNDQAVDQIVGDSSEQSQKSREVKQDVERLDASSLITFNIEHQAAVNRLDEIGPHGILQKLAISLEIMRSSGCDVPDSIQLAKALLLDDGHVEVHAYARSKEEMERLSRIRGWDLEFEKSISVPVKSYAVETLPIHVDSLNMKKRKHKATVIREMLKENLHFWVSLRSVDDIRDIRWCKGAYKEESSLILELRTAQQADEILEKGVLIRGKHKTCQPVNQKLCRCGRCQAFGHHESSCSSALQCGKCASQHATSACASGTMLCADCHGPHQAKTVDCPARVAHGRTPRYLDPSPPVRETEHEKPAPETQCEKAALNLPVAASMPITPPDEGEIEADQCESLQNIDPRDRGRKAALRHTPMPTNSQHESYDKVEGSEPTQGTSLAQTPALEIVSIQRDLLDLRTEVRNLRMVCERRPVRQQRPSQKKRRADHMLTGGPPSYARKQSRRATQSGGNYPIQTHSHLPAAQSRGYYPIQTRRYRPADREVAPYPAPLPG